MNTINWDDIRIPHGRVNGNVKTLCPSCSHTRKPSNRNEPCLSVNLDKGVANCWNCGETSFKNERKYTLPDQTWRNHTSLSDKLVKWFKEERGISQQTLIDCRITEEAKWQPARQAKVNNIVFNYFYGDVLVNKKYRSADKCFTQEKNARKVFYGINDLKGFKTAYLVEGEADKLAFWEMGITNVISVPNGAKDLNDVFDNCRKELETIETFYIAVDSDEAGKELEENIVRRIGAWKCKKIEFDYKDANDQLINDRVGFLKLATNLIPYPINGTYTSEDIKSDIFDFYEKGYEQTLKPEGEEWEDFNENFSILMGQLTVVTGIPSHGKSNFLEWYVMSLMNTYDNLKTSFFSPEHLPMSSHQAVLAEKFTGKSFPKDTRARMSKDELNQYIEWSKQRIFITTPDEDNVANWDWLLETFKNQIYNYGINIFVIDAFNKVKRESPDSIGEISQVLNKLTSFAQAHKVHVFLVAHPTKMRKNENGVYEVPTLYDVKGTGDFRDQTHNGLAVYRNFSEDGDSTTDVYNLKAKFKHQGSGNIGKFVPFQYNTVNGRYHKKGMSHNNKILTDKFEYKQQVSNFNEPEVDPDDDSNNFYSNSSFKRSEYNFNNTELNDMQEDKCPF